MVGTFSFLADQAIAGLCGAFRVRRGWPDERKEPDFDLLRGQDDFQKPLAEVKAKTDWEAESKGQLERLYRRLRTRDLGEAMSLAFGSTGWYDTRYP